MQVICKCNAKSTIKKEINTRIAIPKEVTSNLRIRTIYISVTT